MSYKYLFGPVNSRRLGISLGVDVVPYKYCSMNCLYCECGSTTELTAERKPYIESGLIISELDDFLKSGPGLDFITFSGGGEPTLNSEIGKIITFIKTTYPEYKIALLTNGSLLRKADVIDDIKDCDLIIPSLDAVSEDIFYKINRPGNNVKAEDIVDGIKTLQKHSAAKIWIEIFIIPGMNDSQEEIKKIKEHILDINPEKIQLNTLDRPGSIENILPASREELKMVKAQLEPLDVDIVADPDTGKKGTGDQGDIMAKILALISRRPSTADDIKNSFDIDDKSLNLYLHDLEKSDKITTEIKKRGVFYKINHE